MEFLLLDNVVLFISRIKQVPETQIKVRLTQ